MIGEAISEVLKDKDCLIIFFGSVVKGNLRRTSDIDVGIYCGEKLDPLIYIKILEALENLPMLRKVDLVDLGSIENREFLSEILREGLIWKGSENLLKDLNFNRIKVVYEILQSEEGKIK